MSYGRRVLYSRERVRNLVRAIRADAWASHYDTVVELRRLQLEVAELRDIFGLVVATLRTQAEADVATLRRQLEYALARIERRPDKPLH